MTVTVLFELAIATGSYSPTPATGSYSPTHTSSLPLSPPPRPVEYPEETRVLVEAKACGPEQSEEVKLKYRKEGGREVYFRDKPSFASHKSLDSSITDDAIQTIPEEEPE